MWDAIRPYASYRASGLHELGEVPTDWDLRRAKVFLHEVDDRSTSGDEELLSVSHKTGVTTRREKNVTMFLAESNAGHKRCQPGDVVINTMWAWMAALGVATQSGIVSPSYGVYRPWRPESFTWAYLDELLRTQAYRFEYNVRSSGITDSRLRLYPDAFLGIPLLQPPHQDQVASIKFARHIDRALRSLLHGKRRILTLLGEMRDVATQNAIDASGTSSQRVNCVVERMERPVARDDEQLYTPIGLHNRGRGLFHKKLTKGADLGDSSFFWLNDGDLVLSGQFAWEGAIAIAGVREQNCIASHRYPILRAKSGVIESAYLFALLRTPWGQVVLNHHSRGAAGRNRPLNATSLLKERIPVPSVALQKGIEVLVVAESRWRESLIRLERLLREYRTRLIADVVTGKLDVREAANLITDETDEATSLLADEEPVFETEDQVDDAELAESAGEVEM